MQERVKKTASRAAGAQAGTVMDRGRAQEGGALFGKDAKTEQQRSDKDVIAGEGHTMPTDRSFPTKRTMPRRPPNAELRSREYLTPDEVDRLIKAAKRSARCGDRDGALILLGYRHGLRVCELVALRWEQIDLDGALIHVRRAKGGTPSVQPLAAVELRALRPLRRRHPSSPWVFVGMGGAPLTTDGVRRLVQRAGLVAELPMPVHPHMLRHGAGYKLANDGVDTRTIQAYLGHRRIDTTVRYTELSAGRFAGLWQE